MYQTKPQQYNIPMTMVGKIWMDKSKLSSKNTCKIEKDIRNEKHTQLLLQRMHR